MISPLTPHGPGFRFIDSFEYIGGGKGVASVVLSPDHPVFESHFPGRPIFPAVLLVECAAQGAGVLWMRERHGGHELLFLASVEQFRVLEPVLPGETVATTVEMTKDFGSIAQFSVECLVSGRLVGRGRLVLSRQLNSEPTGEGAPILLS